MTERGLKNIKVFYSTFTNVFLSRFLRFLFFLEHFLHLRLKEHRLLFADPPMCETVTVNNN